MDGRRRDLPWFRTECAVEMVHGTRLRSSRASYPHSYRRRSRGNLSHLSTHRLREREGQGEVTGQKDRNVGCSHHPQAFVCSFGWLDRPDVHVTMDRTIDIQALRGTLRRVFSFKNSKGLI